MLPQGDEDEFYRDTPIFTCKFSPHKSSEHLIALANEDGKLAIHDCQNNRRHGAQAHNNAIFDLAWMFDQMKLVTASGDHTSKLYDIGNGEVKSERVFCGHTRSVKTVTFRKDDSNVFATGGRDGDIIIWDIRTCVNSFVGKADRTINNSHFFKPFTPSKSKKKFSSPTQSGVKSVTGLVFQESNTLISCGAGDGVIKIWDLRKNYVTYKKEAVPKSVIPYSGSTTKNGYSSLLIDNTGTKLFANCLDNTIYCYNVGTYSTEPIMRYTGHQNSSFYVKSSLCKNGDFLVSGSSDENAYVWSIKHPNPIVKLTGHTAEVTCVAWSNKQDALITCSDDMTHMIWTVGSEELPEDWEIVGRGKAEVLPFKYFPKKLKLINSYVPEGKVKKLSFDYCRTNNYEAVKRKNTSNLDNPSKIFQTEFGPRRLFGNIAQCSQIEKTETLAKYLDENEDPLTINEEYEPPSKLPKIESLVKHNSNLLVIKERSENNQNVISAPRVDQEFVTVPDADDYEPQNKMARLEITPKRHKNETVSSPTINLPNYVVDGIAPHLNFSPPKKKCQDWLTKLRVEKMLRQEMYDKTVGQSSPRQTKSDLTPKKPKHSSPKSPLLRYFRITSTQKCDGLGCSKYHNCSSFSSTSWKQNDS